MDASLVTWIAICGATGAVGRFWLGWLVTRATGAQFPYGTMVVNLVGCLAMGLVTFLHESEFVSFRTRQALAVGLLGGFTTFSAFGLESYQLLLAARWWAAGINVAVQVIAGVAAIGLGIVLGRWIAHL